MTDEEKLFNAKLENILAATEANLSVTKRNTEATEREAWRDAADDEHRQTMLTLCIRQVGALETIARHLEDIANAKRSRS